MHKVFRSDHSSCKIHLEEKKKKTFLSEGKKQALHFSDDIAKLKFQVKQKEKTVKMKGDEFVECVRMVEEKNDMGFMIKDQRNWTEKEKKKKRIITFFAFLDEFIVEVQNKKLKVTS